MIKFFRNIRQNLLNEGKTTKYFKYAIGEIILVVIGILIALQINNWNENRKKRLQENYYLDQLLADFNYNKTMVKWNKRFSTYQRDNATLLLKSLHDSIDKKETAQWFYAVNQLWFVPHYSFNDNTWEELKSTGNIGVIRNKTTVQNLSEFYSNVENIADLEQEWAQFNLKYRSKVNNILEPELRFKMMKKLGDGDLVIQDSIEQFPPVNPYIQKLKQIEGIEGLISDIQINREVGQLAIYSEMDKGIDSIISLLKTRK